MRRNQMARKAAAAVLCIALAATAGGCGSGLKAGATTNADHGNTANGGDDGSSGSANGTGAANAGGAGEANAAPSADSPAASGDAGASAPADSQGQPQAGAASGQGGEQVQIRAKLTDFQWIDDRTGYVWGNAGKRLRLYRTADGGESWTDVTPAGEPIAAGAAARGRSIVFLDAEHGWISAARDGKPNLTLRTTDGGATWQSAALDKPTYAAALDFVDKNRGWLMTSSDAAMGSTEKTLYATVDGGATWKAVAHTPEPGAAGDAQKTGGLPFSGTVEGMSFTDARNGWLALTSHAEKPILLRTTDGGATWDEAKLTLPDDRKDDPANDAGAPVFDANAPGHGLQLVSSYEGDRKRLDAFVTSDGGGSWTFRPLDLDTLAAFRDSSSGWGWRNGSLYRTADGGATWSRLQTDSVLAGKLKTYPLTLAMQFGDEQAGWLLLGSEDGARSILLRTVDGGAHWTVQ